MGDDMFEAFEYTPDEAADEDKFNVNELLVSLKGAGGCGVPLCEDDV